MDRSDTRPPVPFLRSFADEEMEGSSSPTKAFLDYSLELRLSKHFTGYGPFVAVGCPSDTVPQLGAARLRLSDDAWQAKVTHWISTASTIVIFLGRSHWIKWELAKVFEARRMQHTILVLPEVKAWSRANRFSDLSRRMALLRAVCHEQEWGRAMGAVWDFTSLRTLIFQPNGSVLTVVSGSFGRDSYHLAVLIAHYLILNSVQPQLESGKGQNASLASAPGA